MSRFRWWQVPALAMGVSLLAGCGGSYSGVQAEAPAPQSRVSGVTPDSGDFTLYRATGFEESHDPTVQPVWTVSLSQGQRVGFRWVSPRDQEWAPRGALHLMAYAGGQTRDLGSFTNRDVKYVWAGSRTDVRAYFQGQAGENSIGPMLMQ